MSDQISLKELVEVRKQEMASMRPNLYTEVRIGEKSIRVESPTPLAKSGYKVKD